MSNFLGIEGTANFANSLRGCKSNRFVEIDPAMDRIAFFAPAHNNTSVLILVRIVEIPKNAFQLLNIIECIINLKGYTRGEF